MTLETSPAVDEMIQRQLATGRFADENEVLTHALRTLEDRGDYDATDTDQLVANLEKSLEDERRGDVMPVREFEKLMREEHEFLRKP